MGGIEYKLHSENIIAGGVKIDNSSSNLQIKKEEKKKKRNKQTKKIKKKEKR